MSTYFWQEPIWQQLLYRLREQRVAHAVLLSARQGLGVDELAQRYARRLLCERAAQAPDLDEACGQCAGCAMMSAGSHPDHARLTIADDKQSIVIDQIRELTQNLQQRPVRGGYRVAVIEQADTMTVGAANALLKTLEEPGERIVLLLLVTRAERLPATIRSRCQQLTLAIPTLEASRQWLLAQGGAVNLVTQALTAANGAPLAAQKLLKDGGLAGLNAQRALLERFIRGELEPLQVAASVTEPEPFFDELLRQSQAGMQQLTPAYQRLPMAVWAELCEQTLEARRQLRSASHLSALAVLEALLLRWFDLLAKFGHS